MSIERLVDETNQLAQARARRPANPYRLQMHAGFTLPDVRKLLDYFHSLGVTHFYFSPLLAARPGSQHGYDVQDHERLNPEIGTDDDLAAVARELHERGMGMILDVVPNHMAIGSQNPWWIDVLEHGPSSPFAGYFDIAWNDHPRERLHGKVLLPILGEPYGQTLEGGHFVPKFENGAFFIELYNSRGPIDPRTYGVALAQALEVAGEALGREDPDVLELQSILNSVRHLPSRTETDAIRVAEGRAESVVIKRRLADLVARNERIGEAIQSTLAGIAGTPGDRASFNTLEQWLEAQAYRPAFWRVATDEINYRRFFDVNELAAISTERRDVFLAAQRKIFEWLADGLRIDHPDGLFNPLEYLQRLQVQFRLELAKRLLAERPADFGHLSWDDAEPQLLERFQQSNDAPLYVVVEKILGPSETLPPDWPMDGTTGYEFLTALNGLFVDPKGEAPITAFYERFTGDDTGFDELVYQKKFLILQSSLAGELHVLAHQLDRLAQQDRWSRDFTLNGLRHALREVIACFPVYRSYVDGTVRDVDRNVILRAIVRARRRSTALFDFIRDRLLLKDPPSGQASEEYQTAQVRFVGSFQQVTSPVMAKGVEDTALYIFNRLVSLNEVGGSPTPFGTSPIKLHQYLADRASRTPAGLSPLTTHDTKRSEDTRSRINVLSELPEEWTRRVTRWAEWNARHRIDRDGESSPDRNEEYLLYQTLVGAWPLEDYTAEAAAAFAERIRAYMSKATHEAKIHTSWITPIRRTMRPSPTSCRRCSIRPSRRSSWRT
jgi:(1->4)-alpha-D-glucan 1-alpha-D-glucosylmutase